MTDTAALLAEALRDRYTLERELGRGGMATVYLAEDRKHGRKVAIKVLHPELSALLGAERFLAEIKVTASLQHPHILVLIDSGTANGHLYYVMPHVSGESLRQRLLREKQLPLSDALRLATEIADALDYAHERGVIHRDIKPENILLQGGHALVADFGIALAVQQAGGTRMTETGLSLGTPQYMSPEQATGERTITGRSDVYALGAVTYELLTGDPPFTASTAQGVLAKVMTEEPRPPSALRRSVPRHVDDAVLTALEKLPADRFSSGAEFSRALAGSTTAGEPTRRRKQGTQRLVLAAAVPALALAAGYFMGDRVSKPNARGELRRFSISLPDSLPLAVGTGRPALVLTPDGSRLVYAGRVHGEGLVLVKDLKSDSVKALPGSAGGSGPAVSPSGEIASFLVGSDLIASAISGGRKWRMEAVTPVTRGAAWLSESTAAVAASPNGWLIKVPLRSPRASQNPREWLTGGPTSAPGTSHAWPELLPGGKALLYVIADDGDPSNWRIAARRLDGGPERVVVQGGSNPRYAASGHIVFIRQDALWALPFDPARLEALGRPVLVQSGVLTEPDGLAHYTFSSDGMLIYADGGGWQPSRRLVWIDPDGKLEPVPIADGMYENVALAPDGRRVALVRIDGNNHDVWLGDLARGTLIRLTRHAGEDGSPVWSPDARQLAIASEQWGDPPKLAIVDLVRGGVRLAVDTGFRFSAPTAWSAKKSRLFFVSNTVGLGPSATGADIATFDGSVERFWLQTANDEAGAAVSSNGDWVAYVSNETGRKEVYLRPASGIGAHVPVSSAGGSEPRWGKSGRTLYFRRGDRILAVELIGTSPSAPELSQTRVAFRFPPSFVTDGGFNGATWDITHDERRILALDDRKHLSVTTLRVVLNWFDILRQAAPPSDH